MRKLARNCRPCVRSLVQVPAAWTHSPAEIIAAWAITVTRSRCPRAFSLNTQKPFSSLWNVTRSTSPARFSVGVPDYEGCAGRSFTADTAQ